MDVRYRLTMRDLVVAIAAANRYSKLSAVMAVFGVAITAFSWLTGDPTWPLPALLGFGFATGIVPGLIGAWGWRRRPDLALGEIHVVVEQSGLTMTTPTMTSTAKWALFRRMREAGDAFILDFGTGMGTFIPRRALESAQAETLRDLARTAGVLDVSSSWRLPVVGTGIGVVVVAAIGGLFASGILVAA